MSRRPRSRSPLWLRPGVAGAIGSNYVSLEDNVYIIQGNTCYRLDTATGETVASFNTPTTPESTEHPDWGFLSIHGDVLVAGIQPVEFKTHAFNLYELRKYGNDLFDVIRSWKEFEGIEPYDTSLPTPYNVEQLMAGVPVA